MLPIMSTLTDPLQNTCFLDFVKKYFLAPVTRYDQVSYCSSGNRADHLHQTGVVFADNANHTKEKAYVNKKVNLPPFSFEKTLAIALAHCYLVQLKKPNKRKMEASNPCPVIIRHTTI